MKKFLLLLYGLLAIHCLHAQGIKYSVTAGFNLSGAYATEDGQVIKGGPLPGFQIGASAEKIIAEKFSFQPSLLFVYGGTYRTGIDTRHDKYHASLIEIPLDVVYRESEKFFFGAGPYIGYAIAGTHTFRGQSYKINFGNNPELDDSRRLDAGISVMAGYALQPALSVKACFNLGLINPALAPLRVNTRILEIMIAYSLKKD